MISLTLVRQAPGSAAHLYLLGRSGFHRSLAHEPGVTVVGLRDLFAADLEYER